MGQPIVHFEISGHDLQKLRSYYGDLFGWEFDTSAPVAETISQRGNYGFVNRDTSDDGVGIPGGVGGGPSYNSHAIFYVGVPNVGIALQNAERLGGTRVMGPVKNPGRDLMVAHFTDPEGNLIGLVCCEACNMALMRSMWICVSFAHKDSPGHIVFHRK
jgi:uncharacterized protein